MKPRRSEMIKGCRIIGKRPGIIQSFMIPTKLKKQVRPGTRMTDLTFVPSGKTLVGGTQWTIELDRPGIARPIMIALEEKKALRKIKKAMKAEVLAAELNTAEVEAADAAKSKGFLKGWW